MTIYGTSDWHLGHRKIREHEPSRPENFEEVLWSALAVLKEEDQLWFLGDFSFRKNSIVREELRIMADHPGEKYYWIGNHDNAVSIAKLEELGFVAAKLLSEPIKGVLVSHYPPVSRDDRYPERISAVAEEWAKGTYDFMVHGHEHSNRPARWGPENRWINVSPEVNELRLVNLTAIMGEAA